MRQPLPPDVQAALARKDKLEAIRLLRARTALGLAEAKAAVEQGFVESAATSPEVSVASALPPKAKAALAAGDKIGAIRLVREATGFGLKEAKELVDRHEGVSLARPPGLAPGEVPRASSAKWIALLVIAAAAIAWLVLRQR